MVKKADKYSWHLGSSPPTVDNHSLIKHQIVRDYLARYIQVLMSNVRIEKLTLSIVDGFAGGGEYTAQAGGAIHEGSPLIALNTVRDQEALLNVGRNKPRRIDAKYYFVEKLKSNFDYLSGLLTSQIGPSRIGSDVVLLNGSFQEKVSPIIQSICAREGGRRAIFLLDQYAYDQVPAQLLRTIFSEVKGAEVLLTFNVDSLITFLSDKEKSRTKLEEIGLGSFIDWKLIDSLKTASPTIWRSTIQRYLADGLVKTSGARHYTIFYITPMGNTAWTYWLVHLSNNFKARDVMMELHWEHANHFSHYLEPDLFTLGYRTSSDSRATRQESIDLGEAHHFDSLAAQRCHSGLTTKLIPLVYDADKPMQFGELLESIGSSTPATADMIRGALDQSIRQGEIRARALNGTIRSKGQSLKAGDVLSAAQRTIFSLPSTTIEVNP
ncbi:three-Cys-motif partner protein TcmP [Polaromonas sp. P5_D5]